MGSPHPLSTLRFILCASSGRPTWTFGGVSVGHGWCCVCDCYHSVRWTRPLRFTLMTERSRAIVHQICFVCLLLGSLGVSRSGWLKVSPKLVLLLLALPWLSSPVASLKGVSFSLLSRSLGRSLLVLVVLCILLKLLGWPMLKRLFACWPAVTSSLIITWGVSVSSPFPRLTSGGSLAPLGLCRIASSLPPLSCRAGFVIPLPGFGLCSWGAICTLMWCGSRAWLRPSYGFVSVLRVLGSHLLVLPLSSCIGSSATCLPPPCKVWMGHQRFKPVPWSDLSGAELAGLLPVSYLAD